MGFLERNKISAKTTYESADEEEKTFGMPPIRGADSCLKQIGTDICALCQFNLHHSRIHWLNLFHFVSVVLLLSRIGQHVILTK